MCGCGCNKSKTDTGDGAKYNDPGVRPIIYPHDPTMMYIEEEVVMWGPHVAWGAAAFALLKLFGYGNLAAVAAGAGATSVSYLRAE